MTADELWRDQVGNEVMRPWPPKPAAKARCTCGHTGAAHYFAETTLTLEFCELMCCNCPSFSPNRAKW